MLRKITEKIAGRWLFFITVCILYAVVAIVDPPTFWAGLHTALSLLKKIYPALLTVFGLIFVSSILLDTGTVERFLGAKSSKGAWIIAVIAGIVSAGPIYLWYPLLSDLKAKGMRDALIATFLYNRAVKIPLLPLMISYFGLEFVLVLTVYMIIFSVIDGYIVERILIGGEKKS